LTEVTRNAKVTSNANKTLGNRDPHYNNIRDSLARILAQMDKARLSRKEYEKTVKLLKLMKKGLVSCW
jgi:hypothetical protein